MRHSMSHSILPTALHFLSKQFSCQTASFNKDGGPWRPSNPKRNGKSIVYFYALHNVFLSLQMPVVRQQLYTKDGGSRRPTSPQSRMPGRKPLKSALIMMRRCWRPFSHGSEEIWRFGLIPPQVVAKSCRWAKKQNETQNGSHFCFISFS